jgi:uncharacterized protein (TIGR02246 family)
MVGETFGPPLVPSSIAATIAGAGVLLQLAGRLLADQERRRPAMTDAEAVVQEQVEAFNTRDAERFANCYADDASVLTADGSVMAAGKEAIRQLYGQLFRQSPDLHARIAARIAVGDYVIDEEQASGMVFEGMPAQLHAAAVYRVAEGKIQQAQILS